MLENFVIFYYIVYLKAAKERDVNRKRKNTGSSSQNSRSPPRDRNTKHGRY